MENINMNGWQQPQRIVGLIILFLQCTTIHFASRVTAASPGYIDPPRLEAAVGDTWSITCRIQINNSSTIKFYEPNTRRLYEQPSEEITILDSHTAVLTIRNSPEHIGKYRCMSGNAVIGMSHVYVGTPPGNVTDFNCRAYDYSYMACNFTKPHNSLHTVYYLSYYVSENKNYVYTCRLIDHQPYVSFNITSSTDEEQCKYLPSREMYHFSLLGRNALGNVTQVFDVDNRKNVIPAKLDIYLFDRTTSSITLSWTNFKSAYYEEQGLDYEIRLKPEGLDWYTVPPTEYEQCINNTCHVTITNLKYPHCNYTIEVRVKVKTATNDTSMWSEPYVGHFQTEPRPPDHPPQTVVGSFYVDPNEKMLRLYWQQLTGYEENGENFHYTIKEVDAEGNVLNVTKTSEASITFPLRPQLIDYTLRSSNDKGDSIRSSSIRVFPIPRERSLYSPDTVTRLYHNRTYTLSWKPPKRHAEVSNYTVFWCLSKIESANQCKGTLNFQYLDKWQINFTTEPQDHTLILAVSANYPQYSSGMYWATCSAAVSSDLMKLEPEVYPISPTEIHVRWSLKHLCTSLLKGYKLAYCEVEGEISSSDDVLNCTSPQKIRLLNQEYKEFVINDLKPFTMYRIEMLMYSEKKVGPMSDPIYNRTKEAAPFPPRNVEIDLKSVTSNSGRISWQPPLITNGILQYYTVCWSTKNHSEHKKVPWNETYTTLDSLSSYSNYTVYVTAHTGATEGSMASKPVQFLTLISIPSNPRHVNIIGDSEYGILEWMEPEVPSGRVEFYEVLMTLKYKDNSTKERITRVQGGLWRKIHKCRFRLPDCNSVTRLNSYFLSVRAVNMVRESEIDRSTFLARTVKRRRHTNPEISTAITGGVQLTSYNLSDLQLKQYHHFGDEHIEINTVKSNDMDETTSSPSQNPFSNVEYKNDIEYDNDFECDLVDASVTESIDDIIIKMGAVQTYRSKWQDSQERYKCTDIPWDSSVFIPMTIIILSVLLAASSYWLHKKYKQMKNIKVVLPEGLIDSMNHKFGDEKLFSRENSCMGSDVSNGVEEKANTEIVSGLDYFTKGNCSFMGLLNNLGEVKSDEIFEVSSEEQEQSSDTTDTMELNEVSLPTLKNDDDGYVTASQLQPPEPESITLSIDSEKDTGDGGETNGGVGGGSGCLVGGGGGYVTPSSLMFTRPVAEDTKPIIPNANGYVQPHSIMMLSPPTTVQPLSFQPNQMSTTLNNTSTDGYITADAIGKAILAPSTESANKFQTIPNMDVNEGGSESNHSITNQANNPNNNNNNNLICGYVTQRQLAEFGQLIH